MKELKKGDFTGIYSSIDGKPLYYTGVFSVMEYDGMPCVFLATDLHNNLTFCRWSQQDLNKRGYIIPPRPVEISKTAMQLIEKAGAVIRWTTAAERKAANTDHKRMSPYIITTAAGNISGPQNPGHACENAPERTERATAEQIHTAHTKSPPQGKTQGRHNTRNSRGHPGKNYFFRMDSKNRSDHREFFRYPILERLVSVNIVKKFLGSYSTIPPGVSKINTFPGAKNFFQKL